TQPVIADLNVTPSYFNPSPNPYATMVNAQFSYTLSKTSDVAAKIFNSGNYVVKTITLPNVPAGYGNIFEWDGKGDNGKYVAPGDYRVKLIAVDANGNQSRDANVLLTVFY
ncbi:FlgD immunoglobulin-like domain containing protein, partial [Thermodesulfobacteriota bacterium]